MTTNDTNEHLQHVGALKYINLFTTHADTHIQRVGYIINGQYMILNDFLPFFISFSLSLNWEREREYIVGYWEKQSYNLLIFSDGFMWRKFSLIRADGLYVIFSSGLKVWLLLVQDSFRYLYPESWHETRVLSRRPHLQNSFSLPLFPLTEEGGYFRFGILANHLASIFFLPLSGDPSEVTEYRLPDPHFFFLQRPAEVDLHSLFVF